MTSESRFAKIVNHLDSENSNSNKSSGGSTFFSRVVEAPPDAIFLTKRRYKEDTDPRKVNVGIGAYRDDNGNPMVLRVVKKAELELAQEIGNKINHEYLPIGGDLDFIRMAQQLMLGDCKRLRSGCVAGAQGLSGTGSLRILLAFLKTAYPNTTVHISNPTWGNHKKMARHAGLRFMEYRYWNAEARWLVVDDMLVDLRRNCKRGDVLLLHACAHNPTGVDPTMEEWRRIADCCQELGLIPFFDSAYQGFATGDLDRDAGAVRLFESLGMEFLLAQSFAKNLGLYNERIGCATVVCNTPEAARACNTQLRAVIRPMYSNPPAFGARIVKKVLSSPENFALWKEEMGQMSGRLLSMRKRLRQKLEQLKTPGTWNHVTDQIGMFCFTGLTPEQVKVMTDVHHIYMLTNGRISMAGVASSNVDYIAEAINDVITNTSYYK